jgi:ABC-2 type transport system permease protein
MNFVLRFEWWRMRSLHATFALVVIPIVFTIIADLFVIGEHLDLDRLGFLAVQRDLPLRWVLAAALGAQGFGHDFRYGTIRPAILAFPRRSNIVTGRAAAAGITASVTALTATAITMSLLVPTTTIEPGVLTDLRLWRSIALGVITPGLVAAVAAGLTAITRNYAAALTLLAGWILAVELMSYTLGGSIPAVQPLISILLASFPTPAIDDLGTPPLVAYLILPIYTAAILAAAARTLTRLDITTE